MRQALYDNSKRKSSEYGMNGLFRKLVEASTHDLELACVLRIAGLRTPGASVWQGQFRGRGDVKTTSMSLFLSV